MSKTKGNVIDPIEIIERFGTDAVRFTLASMASPGTDIAFSEARTEGNRAFANKIWNAARFLFMNLDRAREAGIEVTLPTHTPATDPGAPSIAASSRWVGSTTTEALESRWILARLYAVSAEVHRALSDYRFDEAASAIYQFFWGDFCDWYLEIVKLRLNFDEGSDKTAVTAGTYATLVSSFRVRTASARHLSCHSSPKRSGTRSTPAFRPPNPSPSPAIPQAADFPATQAAVARMMQTMQELITTVRALRKGTRRSREGSKCSFILPCRCGRVIKRLTTLLRQCRIRSCG